MPAFRRNDLQTENVQIPPWIGTAHSATPQKLHPQEAANVAR